MRQQPVRNRVAQWCTWAACALAVGAAAVAVVVPGGMSSRVHGVVLPLGVAAAALAASAITSGRSAWLGAFLDAAATLAVLYEMILAASLPVRLAIEGTCPPSTASCPLGFERPATEVEMFAVYSAVIAGAVSLLLIFAAVEARYLRARRPPG
ncbi:MAG TPA: hypothetical protein VMW11_02485 [Candidatus Dormibacteraeota bacterium]|nr:hypothetical protein [Candidatus Dormibacteraeota bacterium]